MRLDGDHMDDYYMGGFGMGGWWGYGLMWIIGLIVVAAIVVAIVFLVRASSAGTQTRSTTPSNRAEAMLEERFARGDIDESEFQSRVEALKRSRAGD